MPSQAEEDLIIRGMAGLLGLEPSTGDYSIFVEIGVGNGSENNTGALAARGWKGFWIGNEPLAIRTPRGVVFHCVQVELDNVDQLPLPTHCNLLSIDIDGNDYWILHRVLNHFVAGLPEIIVVEYNSAWDGRYMVMPYTPGYVWHQGQPFGASLLAWQASLRPFGYEYICTTEGKVNAFFARKPLGVDHGVFNRLVQQGQGDPA